MKLDIDKTEKLSDYAHEYGDELIYMSETPEYIDCYISYTEMSVDAITEYLQKMSNYKNGCCFKISEIVNPRIPDTYIDKYNFFHGYLNETYIGEVYRKFLRLNKR